MQAPRPQRVFWSVALVMALGLSRSYAIDVGEPLYANSFTQAELHIEGMVEGYNRRVTADDFKFSRTPIYIGRVTLLRDDLRAMYVNVGWVDAADADQGAVLLGVGARRQLAHGKYMKVHAVGAVHAVPSYDTSQRVTDSSLGTGREKSEIKYGEAEVGALVSSDIGGVSTQLVAYAGMMVSLLRGDISSTVDYPDAGVTTRSDDNFQEDEFIVGVLGLAAVYPDLLSLRVEVRLLGDRSFSFAIGHVF